MGNRKIFLLLLTLILSISLTVQVEATTKKSSKPIVRTVNGTALVNYPKETVKTVTFKFFAKEKGKWVVKETHILNIGKYGYPDPFVYKEVMKNGTYAVTAKADKLKESSKKTFKVSNVGPNKSPTVYKKWDYSTVAMDYIALVRTSKPKDQRVVNVMWGYRDGYVDYVTWQLKVSLYYIDAKGKLHLVDTKPLAVNNDGGVRTFEATFRTVKGQRDYALAQSNKEGKVLGYDFFHYNKNMTSAWEAHGGHPGKSMKFKKSDWDYIQGYMPK